MTDVKWTPPHRTGLALVVWLVAILPQTPPTDTLHAADASPAARHVTDRNLAKTTQKRWHDNLVQWHAISKPKSADNSTCYACHENYEGERLTKVHLAAGVGCGTCHGASDSHCSDEDGVTAPDVMFSKEHILTFCSECHADEDLLRKKVHREAFSGENASKAESETDQTCAECHTSKHRLMVRSRKWDKNTSALLWADGSQVTSSKRVGGG